MTMDNTEARELRLNEILLIYEEAVEQGASPDQSSFLAEHSEFAEDLAEYFEAREQFGRLAAPLHISRSTESSADRSAVGAARFNPGKSSRSESTGTSSSELGRVGDFRLLREIGRGGMGIVYEAEQMSLRRRVALKMLPFSSAIDPRQLQRFRNEAEAAASLHHTNIVPVFAVGTERGVHYYAMQFIEGVSIAELIDQLRDDRNPKSEPATRSSQPEMQKRQDSSASMVRTATPVVTTISAEHALRSRPYFRRVAEIGRQAAEALEYAHQVGIVHRDIKPANLLLDGRGSLWITDFGLAQFRTDTGLTATGELVGTLRYMSPEQAGGTQGLVDHRTDVYSLGVTLYELLTLVPLLTGRDRVELLRQIDEVEPIPPRAWDRTVPVELETIILKAVSKSPTDRYGSAQEFANDLQRFLDDRPILARRPTLVDRATKWIKRHRTASLAGVLLLLVTSIGFGVSTAVVFSEHATTRAALSREKQAREREQERAAEAETRRLEAEENYRRTRRAVDMFVELSDEELLDFPPLLSLRRRLLEAAVAYYQELNDGRQDPALTADLAASRARLARLLEDLSAINEFDSALLLKEKCVRSALQLSAEQLTQADRILDTLTRELEPNTLTSPAEPAGKRRVFSELARSTKSQLEELLSVRQMDRLRQILLQQPGPHVFANPATATALSFTEEQSRHVRRIYSEATIDFLRRLGTTESFQSHRAEFAEVWREANGKIIASLTPSQRIRWREMTGDLLQAPIEFPPSRSKVMLPKMK